MQTQNRNNTESQQEGVTSCRSTVALVFNVYYKIKGRFVLQAFHLCIFKHSLKCQAFSREYPQKVKLHLLFFFNMNFLNLYTLFGKEILQM